MTKQPFRKKKKKEKRDSRKHFFSRNAYFSVKNNLSAASIFGLLFSNRILEKCELLYRIGCKRELEYWLQICPGRAIQRASSLCSTSGSLLLQGGGWGVPQPIQPHGWAVMGVTGYILLSASSEMPICHFHREEIILIHFPFCKMF